MCRTVGHRNTEPSTNILWMNFTVSNTKWSGLEEMSTKGMNLLAKGFIFAAQVGCLRSLKGCQLFTETVTAERSLFR